MTKSEIFLKAHTIAKATAAVVGDYMIAMSLALKEIYSSMKKAVSVEEKLVAAGLKVWEGGKHRRIYVGNYRNISKAFPRFSVNFYKSGSVQSAGYMGQGISNSLASKIIGSDFYYDCVACEWVNVPSRARELFGI